MHRRIATSLRDLITDVAIELRSQPAKTGLLIMAVALSIGALVVSVGISRNAAHQIDADLAASTVRLVSVEATDAALTSALSDTQSDTQDGSESTFFPSDAQQRLSAIDAVESAGLLYPLDTVSSPRVTRRDVGYNSPSSIPEAQRVSGATSGFLPTDGLTLSHGDASLLDSHQSVAFLGVSAANTLGIPEVADTHGLSFEINGEPFSVGGFLAPGSDFDDRIMIPYRVASTLGGNDALGTVLIKAEIGAGNQVSQVAAVALKPDHPEQLAVSQVISAEQTRDSVAVQMAQQAMWVGAFLIVLTTLLIANSMIVAVTARTTEIGVRRALGSSRSAVAAVFLFEGGLIGFLGGLAGGAIAAWAIVLVAWVSDWTATIDPRWIIAGPLLGAGVGLIASIYPAIRAARIQPAIAVRSN